MGRLSYRFFSILAACTLALSLSGCPGFFTPRTDLGGTGSTPRFAYVANFQNGNAGSISAFTVNSSTGALTLNGSAISTGGSAAAFGPASLVTVLGKYLYSANDGGSVSAFSINTSTGALTAVTGSPFGAGTNPNAVIADPTGKFLYVADSGSRDIFAYSINSSTGALSLIATFPAGSSAATAGQAVGLAMHPTGKFLYVAMDSAGIAIFSIDPSSGVLTFAGTISALNGGTIQSIAIEKTGSFAYATDGVSAVDEFSINTSTGALTSLGSPVASGNTPIVLTTDAAGAHVYVANQSSNNVFSYGILTNGGISLLSGGTIAAGVNPSSIAIEPSGKFLYVTNFGGGPDVSVYTFDANGVLVNSSSVSTGVAAGNPAGIAFL